jgi:hypothetical protein
LAIAFCSISTVTKTSPLAAACIQRRIGTTPAARWKASPRSICGIDSAIGL